MTTPAPPFEGGSFDETLLVDLENNRLRLEQKASGFGFDGDNTVTIVDGAGQCLRQPREDHHADPRRPGDPAAVHPVPPAPAEPAAPPGPRSHEFAALPRRGPVRGPSPRSRDFRDAGHAAGRALRRCRHGPGVEVRAHLRRLADGCRSVRDHLRRLPEGRQLPGAAPLDQPAGQARTRPGTRSRPNSIRPSPTNRSVSPPPATRRSSRCRPTSTRKSTSWPRAST